jgi:3-hydroxybutyryl-CoA dehydrogenase/5-formyl-3-hydroxy-2-methylpyridine 4-carboxylate dehydrogenase
MTDISRAAVIGTGTMGPGMGAVLERAGLDVTLYDVSEEALERAKQGTELARGVLERLGAEDGGGALRFEGDLAAALEGAEFVIEAVPENLELKQKVYRDFEEHVGAETVLASNTSGIPITKIAEGLEHPERVIGMHWSNPPHLIPMIEVIPGEPTGEDAVNGTIELVERIGYYPCLLKKEVPGFVENRVLYAIMRECLALVDEGIGYKLAVIPPMQLLDVAGLDIYESVANYLNSDLSTESGVSETITKLTGEEKLGIKAGGGLFEYSESDLAELPAKRAAALVAVRKTLDQQDV